MDLENRLNIEVEIQFLVKISFSLCLAASPREPLPFHLNTSIVSLADFTNRCCKKIERREGKKEKKKGEDGEEKGKA